MPSVLDLTEHLAIPLPHVSNVQTVDVGRLRDAFSALDTLIFALQGAVATKAESTAVTTAVNSAIAQLVGDAPAALDTLKELAQAVNNDASFAASVTAALAGKLPNTPASPTALGGVKIGSGLVVDIDGTLSVVGGGGGGTGLPAFDELVLVPTGNGQTTLTPSGGYNAGQIELYQNGVMLYGNGDDYTATNGTTIVLAVGANTTDTFLLRRWKYLPSANAVNKTGDTMSGALNWSATATLASAATVSLGSASSNRIIITGTTAITSFGSTVPAGGARTVTFADALTLTHNAASLILPGGANITTAAGDVAEFESLGSGNWRCTSYLKAKGEVPTLLYSPELHYMLNL